MKRMVSILWMCASVIVAAAQGKVDEERMQRDIEIAENVLSTMIKQQLGKRNFFPYEVNGNYTPGYGVTFRLPGNMSGGMLYLSASNDAMDRAMEQVNQAGTGFSFSTTEVTAPEPPPCEDCPKAKRKSGNRLTLSKRMNGDSISNNFNQKMIEASRNFIADYGDLISQLGPDEKIMITNRNEGEQYWVGMVAPKRKFISLEGTKKDITSFKQGKMTRDQFMTKITLIDSESSDENNPDLELLSSIFNRLYRADLSKTYYTQGNIYYERLKNYGVIFHMQVYSSNESDFGRFDLPTANLEDVEKSVRDKKVAEMYPLFEKDIKESILDYGRTVKSLKDEEMLVFNIAMTRCEGCGIPRSLELSVKSSVLQEYGSGKITKEAALSKINIKKGPAQ